MNLIAIYYGDGMFFIYNYDFYLFLIWSLNLPMLSLCSLIMNVFLIQGINKNKLLELLSSDDAVEQSRDILTKSSLLVHKGFGLKAGENMVMANGRVSLLINADVFSLHCSSSYHCKCIKWSLF